MMLLLECVKSLHYIFLLSRNHGCCLLEEWIEEQGARSLWQLQRPDQWWYTKQRRSSWSSYFWRFLEDRLIMCHGWQPHAHLPSMPGRGIYWNSLFFTLLKDETASINLNAWNQTHFCCVLPFMVRPSIVRIVQRCQIGTKSLVSTSWLKLRMNIHGNCNIQHF